jgi:hypothetical protein
MAETVLLVEVVGTEIRCRPIVLERPGITDVLTRMQLSDTQEVTQLFRCVGEERDLTGRLRVFREVVAPAAPEPGENPLYDEQRVIFTDSVSRPTIF